MKLKDEVNNQLRKKKALLSFKSRFLVIIPIISRPHVYYKNKKIKIIT